MSLLVGGNKKNLLKNIVAKASPSPNCWGIYALLCSFKLQKPSAHWSFSGKGFKCTHIVNPLYISSVANNVLRRGSILCLYLTMFTSAFTECDNPFSMESDPLEQRLKGVCVCVCVSLCMCLWVQLSWNNSVRAELSRWPRKRANRDGGSEGREEVRKGGKKEKVWYL